MTAPQLRRRWFGKRVKTFDGRTGKVIAVRFGALAIAFGRAKTLYHGGHIAWYAPSQVRVI